VGALFNIGTDEFRPVVEGIVEQYEIVELKQPRQIGMRVRVKRIHNMPEVKGQVGTIKERYGGVHFPAFKVSFEDGQSRLFWPHELEEAEEV